MEFIKKLLGRGEAPEPQPETEMVSRAEYDRLEERFNRVVAKAERLGSLLRDCQQTGRELSEYGARYLEERDTARAEAEANAAELAQWRQYGQMRDPKTGRLVPRVKAEVAANV